MKDYPRAEAEYFIKEKQSMEVGLAFDLYEIFNKEMLPNFRSMCQQSILKVDKQWGASPAFKAAYKKDWRKYACFHGLPFWHADHVLGLSERWTASECGDWIRVYGEIIEKKTFFGIDQDKLRKEPQKGPAGSWDKTEFSEGVSKQKTSQPTYQPDNLRRRVELKALSAPQRGDYIDGSTPSRELMASMPFAGIKKWAIMANDITGKMDRVFGLLRGATISGTTTDNIYFLRQYGQVVGDPVNFLLPLGTIVAGGHHSLIEVALPLTINGLVDYRVGCYSTLFPDREPKGTNDEAARIIRRVLVAYEIRPENRLMLVYYRGGSVDGCLVCEKPDEKQQWKETFRADKDLMNEFIQVPPDPSKGQIETFAMRHGLYAG